MTSEDSLIGQYYVFQFRHGPYRMAPVFDWISMITKGSLAMLSLTINSHLIQGRYAVSPSACKQISSTTLGVQRASISLS